ncbi:AraC family transcriptional regulator [Nonomuraea phyllanthi]|uniref:AraC family transcriptional regulator n=1 Tax=Nonomuraea phyllanthi TaxID=2219224 RepID=A0A5C4WN00_9ACTN|nr:DJ-1/PfpI family protein [Nonomuraea phyllanthi]KAB8194712.1 AraC family transcriptional regulator [Nonomuraea phyllanthi]QFY09133.1 AraC family transcriptional regulator [Nonomuraea phyllanthi]
MTVHGTRPGRIGTVGRFVWHYIEMVIAMGLGMLLLGMVWSAVLPEITRTDVAVLVMAADMTIGMAVWMAVRRHSRAAIAEMSLAMVLPFVVLLVPYWFGVLPGHLVMSLGHLLMFVLMAVAMLRRRDEYLHHHHRFRIRWKWVRTAAVVLVALLVPGAVSAVNTVGRFGDMYRARPDAVSVRPLARAHDPAKPTVALLVGGKGANAADLLGPYEVLASTGRFNAYVVSAGPRLVPLTGGLDIVPDLTFDELGRLLGEGDAPDAVIIPALQTPEPAEFDAMNAWLRQQSAAGAVMVSVCNGARAFAASGLLDGRNATSHWLRLSGLRADFPQVHWTSGVRYVEDGDVITTGGVLSGIDGALRVVERLADTGTARAAAEAVHWRHYSPGVPARMPAAHLEPSDVVAALNSSYQTGPTDIGVRLTDGVGELELASPFMSYTEQSVVGRTIAVGDRPIRSEHGLTFVPRLTLAQAAGELDRLLVPGLEAARSHTPGAGGLRPEYLHTTEEFAFTPVLRDIARTYDVQTARFAAKTLEYPVLDVELTGSAWPWGPTIVALLLVLLGVAAALAAGMVFRRVRAGGRRPEPSGAPAEPAEVVSAQS